MAQKGCGFGLQMQPFVVKGCDLKTQPFTFTEGLLPKGLLAKNATFRAVLTATLPFFSTSVKLYKINFHNNRLSSLHKSRTTKQKKKKGLKELPINTWSEKTRNTWSKIFALKHLFLYILQKSNNKKDFSFKTTWTFHDFRNSHLNEFFYKFPPTISYFIKNSHHLTIFVEFR